MGGVKTEQGWSVQQTTDGGYIVGGFTNSFGAGLEDIYVIKTNSQGDTLWTRTFGGTGSDRGFCVQQTFDGGYIIAGDSNMYKDTCRAFLVKIDSSGDPLWSHTYGKGYFNRARSVQQTYDSGYVACGHTNLFHGSESDLYLIKTDPAGNAIWCRIFGAEWEEWGYSVRQTLDSGYIAAGYSTSFDGREPDIYLIKVAPYAGGDANQDGAVDIIDVVYLVNYLFRHGPAPGSVEAGDANCDRVIDIADVIYLAKWVLKRKPWYCD